MKKIGVLTSGGDAPGMNAAIRAVVRTAISHNMEVVGILRGYQGLIHKTFVSMDRHSVSNIIQRGGTILKSSRCPEFRTEEGLDQAMENLKSEGIDSLVVIGGDGTFRGALALSQRHHMPIIGIPGTIDNDLFGSDNTIGYDTALNTVVQAVDKIRDTADSHDTLFLVEVMGRDAGFIALYSGLACGAECVLIPEVPSTVDDLYSRLEETRMQNKTSMIVLVAEGDQLGGAQKVADEIKTKFNYRTRVSILGHIQRGGSPTCADRVLASRLGYDAVNALLEGVHGVMVGIMNGRCVRTPFAKATKSHQEINRELIDMVNILS